MLQLSLDWMKMEEATGVVRALYDRIDIIEMGTPMIFEYGLSCVKEMKSLFPEKIVLADMKIMDAGGQEAAMAVQMGADIVTVMGAANNLTIQKAAEAVHAAGKELMVDMLGVQALEEKTRAVEAIGADYICVHTAFDLKDAAKRPTAELECVKRILKKGKTAIAGGITDRELDAVLKERPDVVIVGGGILNVSDRKRAAEIFWAACREKEGL